MKTILFDVDGVFLSEERCFDVSALTAFEILFDPKYLNLHEDTYDVSQLSESEIQSIRSSLFQEDKILNQLKSLGLNSNWDMLFIVASVHFIHALKSLDVSRREYFLNQSFEDDILRRIGQEIEEAALDLRKPEDFLNDVPSGKDNIYQALTDYARQELEIDDVSWFDLNSDFWNFAQELYQEWYLGRDLYQEVEQKTPRTTFKEGYIYDETFIISIDEIQSMLTRLKQQGYTLGIATGRSETETLVPFEDAGILSYFDISHIATASDVIRAEAMYPELKPLGKPNPFSYIAAYNGNHRSSYYQYATEQENCVEPSNVFIVGDSLADLISAKKINATFIGPLTGLKGKNAKEELEAHGANYIINDVSELEALLEEI